MIKYRKHVQIIKGTSLNLCYCVNGSYFSAFWNEYPKPTCVLFPFLKQRIIASNFDVRKNAIPIKKSNWKKRKATECKLKVLNYKWPVKE